MIKSEIEETEEIMEDDTKYIKYASSVHLDGENKDLLMIEAISIIQSLSMKFKISEEEILDDIKTNLQEIKEDGKKAVAN
ncbi:hypothetical protein [Aliarcobacter trophiarum]|uniref:hypothetical protein n=1 Tax=Aliarcobacter trophiarum TaxID=708186 RepID=UPI00100AF467|nr:hypothetical protein [Aliarcobacter trophiarum]RXI28176.1 hypothetical protein CRU89_03040 [Aliarcobacter trophiarum]